MSISWEFTAYDGTTTYDFTDRLQGFDVKQKCGPAMLGRGSAVFTLKNYDGALTPNGSGTYAGLQWPEFVLKLEVTGSTRVSNVFVGFMADFQLQDNGNYSTVTLTALDPYAIIGRSIVEEGFVSPSGSGFRSPAETIEYLINNGAKPKSVNGVKMPKIGQTDAEAQINDRSLTAATVFYTNAQAQGKIEERIANGILPATMGVMWPTGYSISAGTVYWEAECVGEGLSADTLDFTLTESPTGAALELTLEQLESGHNVPEITNAVNITVQQASIGVAYANYETRDDTSAGKYGERAASWPNHFEARTEGTTGSSPFPVVIDLQPYVDGIVNRFSDYRFQSRRARTKQSMVGSTSQNEQAWAYMLDVRYGQWAPVTTIYTPTGASTPNTDIGVIAGRRIQGTPSDVVLTVDLLPAQDYQSFVLDSDTLGVLDTNRLG
jgi:hypothetical protein